MDKKEQILEGRSEPLQRREKETGAIPYLRDLFFGGLYTLWGYCLGGATLPFGAGPLGTALLCAANRRVPYVLAGLLVSAWGRGDRYLLICAYLAILLVRLLVRVSVDPPWNEGEGQAAGEKTVRSFYPVLFSEHIGLRAATSAVAAFGIGVYRLVRGGFLFYDLYGTLLGT